MELHTDAPLHSPPMSASCQPCGRCPKAPYGGIGRRVRLKIEFRKECWFDSGHGTRSFSAVIRQRPQKACLSLS